MVGKEIKRTNIKMGNLTLTYINLLVSNVNSPNLT